MRDNDGRKLPRRTLEEIRIRAVQQIRAEGVRPVEVATALGLDRSTVFGWLARARAGGEQALRSRPAPGRPPKLTAEQRSRVQALLVGPGPGGSPAAGLWTRVAVGQLIQREFGVTLSATSVARLLRSLGLTPRRPLWRVRSRSPELVERFVRERLPAIRAEATRAGALVHFVDEVTHGAGGPRPTCLIWAATPRAALRFAAFEGRFTAAAFIEFCRRLDHETDRPAFLVVDGDPVHRSTAVTQFVAARASRLRIMPVRPTTSSSDNGRCLPTYALCPAPTDGPHSRDRYPPGDVF